MQVLLKKIGGHPENVAGASRNGSMNFFKLFIELFGRVL